MGKYPVHRSDSTAAEIRQAFEQLGCAVLPLGGALDYLVMCNGQLYLIDAKTKRGKQVQKTPTQQKLDREGWPISYVCSAAEAVELALQWRLKAHAKARTV